MQKYDNENDNKTILDAQGYLQECQTLNEDDYSFKAHMSTQRLHQNLDEDSFRIQLNGELMQYFLDCIESNNYIDENKLKNCIELLEVTILGKRVVTNINNSHGTIRVPMCPMDAMQMTHNNIIASITKNKHSIKTFDSSI